MKEAKRHSVGDVSSKLLPSDFQETTVVIKIMVVRSAYFLLLEARRRSFQ